MNNFLFYIYYNITFIITKTSSARQFKIVLLNFLQGRKEKCKTIHLNCLGEMGWWQQDNLDCLAVCFMCDQDKLTLSFCHVQRLSRQSVCLTLWQIVLPLVELSYLPWNCHTFLRIVFLASLKHGRQSKIVLPCLVLSCPSLNCLTPLVFVFPSL